MKIHAISSLKAKTKKVRETSSKGFGSSPPIINDSSFSSNESNLNQEIDIVVDTVVKNEPKDIDEVFAKYGLKNDEKSKKSSLSTPETSSSFGGEIIKKLSEKQLAVLDRSLLSLTLGGLGLVLLSGLGISYGAFKVVYPTFDFPSSLDNIIVNVLVPSLGPFVGIFFLFSISYGLFKLAQYGSEGTVYREE